MRLGLFMRRMAWDWTLSRRPRVEFGAPRNSARCLKLLEKRQKGRIEKIRNQKEPNRVERSKERKY